LWSVFCGLFFVVSKLEEKNKFQESSHFLISVT